MVGKLLSTTNWVTFNEPSFDHQKYFSLFTNTTEVYSLFPVESEEIWLGLIMHPLCYTIYYLKSKYYLYVVCKEILEFINGVQHICLWKRWVGFQGLDILEIFDL